MSSSFVFAFDANQETYEPSGNQQNKEFLQKNIPAGDALLEAISLLAKIVEKTEDLGPAANQLRSSAQNLINSANSCKDISSCQPKCVCDCANPSAPSDCRCQSQSCSPENLCDKDAINNSYAQFKESYIKADNAVNNFIDLVVGKHEITNDIKMLNLAINLENPNSPLESSPIIGKYSKFRQDYNQIMAPYISETSISAPAPLSFASLFGTNVKLPIMAYIKRKTDLTRIQFANCFTSVEKQDDWGEYIAGDKAYKAPVRIDFLLENGVPFPEEPTNPFDYYCSEN